jgi:branched-subunit amino acid aminotransferase/4-amino-4-deoxychorismate lyase
MESTLRDLAPADLVIIETLGYMPKDGFARLGLHMDRVEQTCAQLNVPFDRGETLFALGSAVDVLSARVRMTIDLEGSVSVTTAELSASPDVWVVAISDQVLRSDDPWLGVKTSQRGFYDKARADLPKGLDELIFLNENGDVCEGTITNVFVRRGDVLMTAPLSAGVLPGVLRQELLETGLAVEARLTVDDLGGTDVFVGNSLRGLIKARMI